MKGSCALRLQSKKQKLVTLIEHSIALEDPIKVLVKVVVSLSVNESSFVVAA